MITTKNHIPIVITFQNVIVPTLKTLQVEKGFGGVGAEVNTAVSGCFKEVIKKYKDVSITDQTM